MSISADTLHVARLDTDAVTINSSYPSMTLFFFFFPSITLDDFCLNPITSFQAYSEDQPPFPKN